MPDKQIHTSLRKIVAHMILWCVIPFILAAIYISAVRVFDINSTLQRRAEQIATNLRVALDTNLRSRIAGLQVLAETADTHPLDMPRLYREAGVFKDHFGGSVLLVDPSLAILFSTGIPLGSHLLPKLPKPKGFAAVPHALQFAQPAVGDMVIGNIRQVPLVAVATPMIRQGKVEYALVNTIETQWLQDLLDNLDLPEGWMVNVRDGTGELLAQRLRGAAAAPEAKHWSSDSEVSHWRVTIDIPLPIFYHHHIQTIMWTMALLALALGLSLLLGRQMGSKLYHAMTTLQEGGRIGTQSIAEIEMIRFALQRERDSRTKAEAALRESENRWRYAIEGAGDGLWDWDIESGKVFYSSRWKSMLGYGDEEIPASIAVWGELVHPDDKQRVLDAVQRHIDGHTPEFVQEYRMRCKDGSWKWLLARGIALRDVNDTNKVRMIGVNSDITERKQTEARIEYLAYYDPLTGLANRKLLLDRLQQALSSSRRSLHFGALIFIDLDGFKSVNDLWGHSIGDQMLQLVAQRLTQSLRSGDTVARLGGDEFVILVQNLGLQHTEAAAQASTIADKVLAAFYPPFHMGEHEFHGGASIGVALFSDEPASPDSLIGQADSAMYRAKSEGGSLVRFFDARLQSSLVERSAFESDLRQSILRRQLRLVFQPQCRLDGSIFGAEALLRWHHPELGLILPGRFIPLAEEDNFIVELGRWVLHETCTILATLAHNPTTCNLIIAVNVSQRQFVQPAFVTEVRDLLQQTGADPRRLKLELTESIFARDIDDIAAKMRALHGLGVSFSLDDFGTGYSCLAYLKKLPFDQIKIDQAFVHDLPNEPHDAAIVHAVIALSNSLGIDVLAEGVETADQRDFLELNGCHAFQGFLFSHPVDMAELMQLLTPATV